jgi:hypothetical protein
LSSVLSSSYWINFKNGSKQNVFFKIPKTYIY